MTVTTTDIRWREAPETYGALCIDNATNGTRCTMPVAWCRQWQSSAMAAPAFWYYCDAHGREAAARDGMRTDAPPWADRELPDAYTVPIVADPIRPYAVGAVWHTSWGYDQTNVEFFQVVRESVASVWLAPMGSTIRDGRQWPTVTSGLADAVRIHRKPRAAWAEDHPYIRIDGVRTAWPYNGNGCYSTYAAGEAGH